VANSARCNAKKLVGYRKQTTGVSKAPRSEAKASATEKLRGEREREMYLRTMILSTRGTREETGIQSFDSTLSQTTSCYFFFVLTYNTDRMNSEIS